MSTLCIVPCGSKKIWDSNPNAGPTAAKLVYIGTFAKKCRQYAQAFYPSSWCILSAKYGFLMPDDVVPGPYNVSFNNASSNPITFVPLLQQAKNCGFEKYETLIVLGGKNYVKMIEKLFPTKRFIVPLSDCTGIGFMIQKLNNAIIANKVIN